MDDFLPRHQDNVRQMVADLSEDERRTLLELLIKLYGGFQKFVDDDTCAEANSEP